MTPVLLLAPLNGVARRLRSRRPRPYLLGRLSLINLHGTWASDASACIVDSVLRSPNFVHTGQRPKNTAAMHRDAGVRRPIMAPFAGAVIGTAWGYRGWLGAWRRARTICHQSY